MFPAGVIFNPCGEMQFKFRISGAISRFGGGSGSSARRWTTTTVATNANEKVVIPKAVPRGPTDILKALAATVEKDFTGPHFRYQDDPFLTPTSNTDKRTYSLAKESGRKTARYFVERYPELFFRDISEPKIEAFTYPEIYDETMDFDEWDLQKCIARNDVSNAMICYNKMVVQDGKPVRQETLTDLLELVCFFNCEPEPERYLEEEWFQKNFRQRTRPVTNTWKDHGFAEKLFEQIEPKTDRTWSAIIMGMAKYHQAERAFSFYHRAMESGLKLNTETYNALIGVSYLRTESNDERWKIIEGLLKTMNQNRIAPNLGTLNAVLNQLTKFKFWEQNGEMVKKTFNEFAFRFGIRPSLATYNHVLANFYRSRNSRNGIIYDILERIETETFELNDADDQFFFHTAIDVATNLNDAKLAYRINAMADRHGQLMGPHFLQNNYYTKLLKLLCLSEPIEKFMEVYNRYVPNTYTPTIDLMDQMMKSIKVYKAGQYVPLVYDHLRLFYYLNHIELMTDLLELMLETTVDDRQLVPKFAEIVADLFEKTNLKIARSLEQGYKPSFEWTARTLSLCIAVLNKNQDLNLAFEVVQKLNAIKNQIFDEPDAQALVDFCLISVAQKNPEYAVYCLRLCRDLGKQEVIDSVRKELAESKIQNDEKLKRLLLPVPS